MLEQLLTVSVGFIDTFMVAKVGEAAVSGVAPFVVAALSIWPLIFTLPNALRGAGDVKYSMVSSIISMWFGRVIVSYILVVYCQLGILGIWLGMFVDWYGRGISYLLRFKSGNWVNKKAI